MTAHDPVRREETSRGPRIVIPLGGEEWWLDVERATQLRDELSRALEPAAPAVMEEQR